MSERYIRPDYSESVSPKEDDDLDEITENDIAIEKLLDEQEQEHEDKMSSLNPFNDNNSKSIWGNNNNNQQKPWETKENNNSSVWGSSGGQQRSSWGSGSSWLNNNNNNNGSSVWGSSGNQNQASSQQAFGETVSIGELKKRAVIIDFLDCLYESLDANGKPDILPRGIFDLKPKIQVWEKLAVFSPERVYILFPPKEYIPSVSSSTALTATLDYITACISTFLKIPGSCCVIVGNSVQGAPKETVLSSVVRDWRDSVNPIQLGRGSINEMVYIGAHGGLYDLSSRDLEAARTVGVSFMNVFNLVQSKYILE